MNKVAVVTGATSGIGYAVTELLLKQKINVIALARDIDKANLTKEKLKEFTKDVDLDFIIGDLSDNEQSTNTALQFAKMIQEKYKGKLDILMNIAGRVTTGYHENKDGNELTFAVNHLSVFLITYHLTPFLKKSNDPRVLVVSSLSHYRASINWDNIQNKKMYNILKAYKRSKLYNVLFVKEYARRFESIPIYAIDPGLVRTNIGAKNTSGLARIAWKLRSSTGTDIYYPAKFMIDVATKETYKDLSGNYIKKGIAVKSNPITYNADHGRRLWEYSEELTNISFNNQ
jgi:NAD(P)-dependent dehydrogenase (short-subunit alcohol dehydrogenase family)